MQYEDQCDTNFLKFFFNFVRPCLTLITLTIKKNDSTFSLDNVVLEQYEKNEFMQAVINDLKQFFVFANCTCHNKREKCFKEVGFEAFLERYLEFQSLEKK